MASAVPIRDAAHVHAFLAYFRQQGQYRNLVMATMGIHAALRIGDMLSLRVKDVYDLKNRRVLDTITITEQKTGKSKTIELHHNIKEALELYLPNVTNPDEPLFINKRTKKAISRVQAYRIIGEAAKAVNIPHKVCCHSLRKTFGYHAWKKGTSPVLIMEIYNHSSYNTTKRYLGITQDDKNAIYRNLNI